jgi:choline dehydrogenase-like flavoprotein
MDHPRATLGDFSVGTAEAVQSRFGLFQLKREAKAHFYAYGLALSPELQRKEGLLNCAAFLTEHRAADDPWEAIKRLYARKSDNVLQDTLAIASSPGLVVDGVRHRVLEGRNVPHKLDRLVIDCLVEQVPDRDSRVTLSDQPDPLGIPRARVHWKISELEKRSVMRLAQLFASEVGRIGFAPPVLAGWVRDNRPDQAVFCDVAHPTGTTRMADDPRQGVVDPNCRLHGVEGVYIAGSSVFPTAGHANPTLMIVALALRLADRLKQVHFR